MLQGRDLIREKVRKRDNYTCKICSIKWVEGNRRLDTHHLDSDLESEKGRKYQYNKYCMDKMVTLCHKCHLNLPIVRKKMRLAWQKKLCLDQQLVKM